MKILKWEMNKHGEYHVFNIFWWTLILKEKDGKKYWRLTSEGDSKVEAKFLRIKDAKEVARLIQFGLED